MSDRKAERGPVAGRVRALAIPSLQQRQRSDDVANVTKRLRLTLTADAETVETTVTFTHVEERHWQATAAFDGMCHSTAGHRDERAALLSVTRWLRERVRLAIPPGTPTIVGISGVESTR